MEEGVLGENETHDSRTVPLDGFVETYVGDMRPAAR